MFVTLVDAFARSAARRPGAVAVRDRDRSVTYRELDDWSGALADELRRRGVRRGDRVALRHEPAAGAVAAILGILKCGAAYVPLDVRNPVSRAELITTDAAVSVLVGEAADHCAVPVPDRSVVPGRPGGDEATEATVTPDDTAYVIYTSGTTGVPKGVPISHGNVAALFRGTDPHFELGPDDVWLLFHSLAFDFSVWEIWGALAYGGTLVVLSRWEAADPGAWLDVVARNGVTVLNQTVTAFSTWSHLVTDSGDERAASLRYIVFGGERVPPESVAPWIRHHGNTGPALVNMYGITETTVHATFHRITEADLDSPRSRIGLPLPGFAHVVVDEAGHPVPCGADGELLLSGPQVTAGYLHRPELDEQRFVWLESDGVRRRWYHSGDLVYEDASGLVYLGRKDSQVKLRGHRIELGDVETAVRSHDAVADAVVGVHDFRSAGDMRLVCSYTTASGRPLLDGALREHVAALLPTYMRPARYAHLSAIPRTRNGKVDRQSVATRWEAQHR